jgi:RES domain-containing protein
MVIIRIALKKYSRELFAPGVSGRWNSEGKKVIYGSETLSLASLETMIRRNGAGFGNNFASMFINVPDDLKISEIEDQSLPKGWNDPLDYSICQSLGDDWYNGKATPLLKVPSAVIPREYNYVINTSHVDIEKIKLIDVTEFIPDPRIDDILKNAKK